MKDIYIRTFTGVIFLVAVIGSILIHPIAFFFLMMFFCGIALNEYYLLSGLKESRKENVIFFLTGMLFYIIIGLIGLSYIDIRFAYFLLLAFPLTIVAELYRKSGNPWMRIGTFFTGYLYISLFFAIMNSLFLIPGRDGYFNGILIGLFVLVWSNDIFAYLTGSLLGRHPLFKRISPKKSWEGSFGGLVFTCIAAYVLSLFYKELDLVQWFVMALIIAIFGTLGDLSASLLKRKAGVKDTGKLFPGHGGVIDRFDATVFAAPFVFVYINLI